jgi:predicted component of type VI protein secretion system
MSTDDAATKPTIETVLERINVLGESLHSEIADLKSDTRTIKERLHDFDVRIDRVESVVNATRAEMLTLRADFRE